jgi:hypothetical protein
LASAQGIRRYIGSRERAVNLEEIRPIMTAVARTRAMQAAEIVVPLPVPPERLGPVTKVRSTLVTSSLKTMQERGTIDRYYELLPREYHAPVRDMIAGVWLPVEIAVAHYRACDGLGLTPSEQVEIGRLVGQKIQGTLLGTLVLVAKQAGATPWSYLTQLGRLYERLAVGGGIQVKRVAQKEALIDLYNVPVFDIPYFRAAWRGVNHGLCELFCAKAYVKSGAVTPTRIEYVISWA